MTAVLGERERERPCPVCGGTWDDIVILFIGECEGQTFDQTLADFEIRGCEALGVTHFGRLPKVWR